MKRIDRLKQDVRVEVTKQERSMVKIRVSRQKMKREEETESNTMIEDREEGVLRKYFAELMDQWE